MAICCKPKRSGAPLACKTKGGGGVEASLAECGCDFLFIRQRAETQRAHCTKDTFAHCPNKGSIAAPQIRSRRVVRELRCKTAELTAAELFSAMPPHEAFRLLASVPPTMRKSQSGKSLRWAFYDASRAHFYGKARRMLYIQLPEEETVSDKCGLLLRTMYGTRDASNTWQSDYT